MNGMALKNTACLRARRSEGKLTFNIRARSASKTANPSRRLSSILGAKFRLLLCRPRYLFRVRIDIAAALQQ